MLPTYVPVLVARVEVFSENATEVPSLDSSPAISIGFVHEQVLFTIDNVCSGLSPASAVPTTSAALGQVCWPETFVCAPTADAISNAKPVMLAMRNFMQISFVNLNFLNSDLGFPEEHSGVRILPLSRAEHNELVSRAASVATFRPHPRIRYPEAIRGGWPNWISAFEFAAHSFHQAFRDGPA